MSDNDHKGISRRDALKLLGAVPLTGALHWTPESLSRGKQVLQQDDTEPQQTALKFFTKHEDATVRILVDMIIPRDERSGSATEARVPEFMDFTMTDRPRYQQRMREGLAWIDAESNRRFGKAFADAGATQREAILNDIAWPSRAPAPMKEGVDFFNGFRDLTASGYWSSEIGVKDLRYMGNVFNPNWNGCPPAALKKLGVTYAKFDRSKLKLTPE